MDRNRTTMEEEAWARVGWKKDVGPRRPRHGKSIWPVGHWSYEGADRSRRSIKDLAVKQARYRAGGGFDSGGLKSEAYFLEKFQGIATAHVVKMYSHLYEDRGQSTQELDEIHDQVHRIYLEFCPAGDLWGFFVDYNQRPQGSRKVNEGVLWRLFHCLARAALVIECGNENPSTTLPPRFKKADGEIVHCDLKMDNVLIGNIGLDDEHGKKRPFKVSDFGCAKMAPPVQTQSFIDSSGGTIDFLLPEQTSRPGRRVRPWLFSYYDHKGILVEGSHVVSARLGSASNIWHIGLIMLLLVSQPDLEQDFWSLDPPILDVYKSTLNETLRRSGYTLSTPELIYREKKGLPLPYSTALHTLIESCLPVCPGARISASTLVTKSKQCMAIYQQSVGEDPHRCDGLDTYSEPRLSDRWYSGQKRPPPAGPTPRAKRPKSPQLSPKPATPNQGSTPKPRGSPGMFNIPKPDGSSHKLGANLQNASTYRQIRFVIRPGDWGGSEAMGLTVRKGVRKTDKVVWWKVELAKTRNIAAIEMSFRCGIDGPVMENDLPLGRFPKLDEDSTIEVCRVKHKGHTDRKKEAQQREEKRNEEMRKEQQRRYERRKAEKGREEKMREEKRREQQKRNERPRWR